MFSSDSWFERVGVINGEELEGLRRDIGSLRKTARRTKRLGPGATTWIDVFWAQKPSPSETRYSFVPISHDSRLQKMPNLLRVMSDIELDASFPTSALQVNINVYDPGPASKTGWHRDSRDNGKSPAYNLTVQGSGLLMYLDKGSLQREPVTEGEVTIFHNEQKRALHNVINQSESERVSVLIWQPTTKN